MKKFRVISDLHIDINKSYPLTFDDDIFTIICGDTANSVDKKIRWIKENIKTGVGISGNHLPYHSDTTLQSLRMKLAKAFPVSNPFTYLDCETNVFCKEVDGILFIGTCMYTDMAIKHKKWNPTGDISLNMSCSEYNMNDYNRGIKCKNKVINPKTDPKFIRITAKDYAEWFKNAYQKIDKKLNENEKLENPLPVVLFTHHSLIPDFLENNGYIDNYIYDVRHYNWSSYASDMKDWLLKHTSIKCYCCGHIHDVYKDYRHFPLYREDNSKILVVNNARGYVMYNNDRYFNKHLFVNTKTWEVEI